MSDDEMAYLCTSRTEWVNPVIGKDISELHCIQVYDITVDSSELNNIATPEWLASRAAKSLKNDMDYAINEYTCERIKLNFPKNIHEMTPDKITFCSVQLHHKVRDRIKNEKLKNMKTTGVQTEQISMLQLLTNAFGQNFEKLFANKLQRHNSNHMTLFVPEEISPDWPEWLPLPWFGTFTKETLYMFARYNFEMSDINENEVKIQKNDSTLVVHQALVNPNALSFTNLGTLYIVYKVTPFSNSQYMTKLLTTGAGQSTDSLSFEIASNKETDSGQTIEQNLVELKDHEKKRSKPRNNLGKKLTTDKSSMDMKDRGKAKTNEMRLLQKEAHR
jgi:hypothetical protein